MPTFRITTKYKYGVSIWSNISWIATYCSPIQFRVFRWSLTFSTLLNDRLIYIFNSSATYINTIYNSAFLKGSYKSRKSFISSCRNFIAIFSSSCPLRWSSLSYFLNKLLKFISQWDIFNRLIVLFLPQSNQVKYWLLCFIRKFLS